jgi:hypothetical protein
MRTFRAGAVLAVLAMLCIACGGSSSKTLTKEEFVTQANAICKRDNQAIAEKAKALGENPTQQQQIDFVLHTVIPSKRSEISDVRALKPPKADKQTVTKLLDAASAGIDDAEHTVKADPQKALSADFDPLANANKLATEYGLTDCTTG